MSLLLVFLVAGCWSSWLRADDGPGPGTTTDCELALAGPTVDTGLSVQTDTYHHMDVQWTGSELALVWDDTDGAGGSMLLFARMDVQDGTRSSSVRVDDDEAMRAVHPMLQWTGSRFALAWETMSWDEEIRLRILEAEGTPATVSRRVDVDAPGEPYGIQADLAWTGSEIALSWPYQDTSPNAEGVVLSLHDPSGARSTAPLVFSEGITTHPSVVGADWSTALLWKGDGVHLSVVDDEGVVTLDRVVLGESALARGIATSSLGYGLIWNTTFFHFEKLSEAGEPLGEEMMLGEDIAAPHSSDIVWTRWGWAVAWQDGWHPEDGHSPEVKVAVVDDEITVFTVGLVHPGGIAEPHLAWTGSEIVLLHNDRDGDPGLAGHVMLSRVQCI